MSKVLDNVLVQRRKEESMKKKAVEKKEIDVGDGSRSKKTVEDITNDPVLVRAPSEPTALVLLTLIERFVQDRDNAWIHPYKLADEAGSNMPTTYLVLRTLESKGYVDELWEEDGGRKRHLYRLNDNGKIFAVAALKLYMARRQEEKERKANRLRSSSSRFVTSR